MCTLSFALFFSTFFTLFYFLICTYIYIYTHTSTWIYIHVYSLSIFVSVGMIFILLWWFGITFFFRVLSTIFSFSGPVACPLFYILFVCLPCRTTTRYFDLLATLVLCRSNTGKTQKKNLQSIESRGKKVGGRHLKIYCRWTVCGCGELFFSTATISFFLLPASYRVYGIIRRLEIDPATWTRPLFAIFYMRLECGVDVKLIQVIREAPLERCMPFLRVRVRKKISWHRGFFFSKSHLLLATTHTPHQTRLPLRAIKSAHKWDAKDNSNGLFSFHLSRCVFFYYYFSFQKKK